MAKKLKRLFAMLLAVSMTMSLLSVTAFAEEAPAADPASAEQILEDGMSSFRKGKKWTRNFCVRGRQT